MEHADVPLDDVELVVLLRETRFQTRVLGLELWHPAPVQLVKELQLLKALRNDTVVLRLAFLQMFEL